MPRLTQEELAKFEKDGYLLLRNVFSSKEAEGFISSIRKLREELFPANRPPTMRYFKESPFNFPELENVGFDNRVLDIAKSILGDSAVFFGDGSISMGGIERGFHRDCINRFNLLGPDWDAPYPIIRMGIYLDDFSVKSGGLKIIPGSHRPKLNFLRKMLLSLLGRQIRIFSRPFDWIRRCLSVFQGGYNIPSRPGDVIVWHFRLLHSAGCIRLKRWPDWNIPAWVENILPKKWVRPGVEERMIIFIAFAAEGPHFDRYLETRRPSDLESWKTTRWDSAFEQLAREKRIRLRKPDPAIGELYKR
jgi:hypothetical protein